MWLEIFLRKRKNEVGSFKPEFEPIGIGSGPDFVIFFFCQRGPKVGINYSTLALWDLRVSDLPELRGMMMTQHSAPRAESTHNRLYEFAKAAITKIFVHPYASVCVCPKILNVFVNLHVFMYVIG